MPSRRLSLRLLRPLSRTLTLYGHCKSHHSLLKPLPLSSTLSSPHLSSVAIGIANLLASFFNWYFFRNIEHRDGTDLHRMEQTGGEGSSMETSKA